MRVTMLGCGFSDGVPAIGGPNGRGDWGSCDPANPRNRRTRSSLHIQDGATGVLIDAGPDLRLQLLASGIDCVTHVIFTHDHADHSHGIHELRQLARLRGSPIDAYADAETETRLLRRFGYAFERQVGGFYPPFLVMHRLEPRLKIDAMDLHSFAQDHGFGSVSYGLRLGDMAYSTDVVGLDDKAFDLLRGIGVWIVDAMQDASHPTHSHVEQTLGWIERVKPKRAILTHMSNRLDYETLRKMCPAGVEPGYDGLAFDL